MLVDLVQHDRCVEDAAAEQGSADEDLHRPALAVAVPSLNPAAFGMHHPDLLDTGQLDVVGKLPAEIVASARGRHGLDQEQGLDDLRRREMIREPLAAHAKIDQPHRVVGDAHHGRHLGMARPPRAQDRADYAAQGALDRPFEVRQRRHGPDDVVHEFIAGVGAVLPGEELINGHPIGGLWDGWNTSHPSYQEAVYRMYPQVTQVARLYTTIMYAALAR